MYTKPVRQFLNALPKGVTFNASQPHLPLFVGIIPGFMISIRKDVMIDLLRVHIGLKRTVVRRFLTEEGYPLTSESVHSLCQRARDFAIEQEALEAKHQEELSREFLIQECTEKERAAEAAPVYSPPSLSISFSPGSQKEKEQAKDRIRALMDALNRELATSARIAGVTKMICK
jgi:hypothetical protein